MIRQLYQSIHALGVVHNDIQPRHVIVHHSPRSHDDDEQLSVKRTDGEGKEPKYFLIDFGESVFGDANELYREKRELAYRFGG